MTAILPPSRYRIDGAVATEAMSQAHGAAEQAATERATVIVLTYKHAGAERLRSLLSRHPDMTCTSGTGILPLCEQAAVTWRSIEGRTDTRLTSLAASSIRALTMPAITTVLARQGGRRWCEFANASPRAAETFLQIYPHTRIICLHRSCVDFIAAAIHSTSWGLAGPGYAPFTSAYPHSTVAALTAYWTALTAPLIAFEESHPDACRQIRYEDLADQPYPADLFSFLGMEAPLSFLADPKSPDATNPSHGNVGRAPFPADQVPALLLAQAEDLARKLGYPPLATKGGA